MVFSHVLFQVELRSQRRNIIRGLFIKFCREEELYLNLQLCFRIHNSLEIISILFFYFHIQSCLNIFWGRKNSFLFCDYGDIFHKTELITIISSDWLIKEM